MTSASSATPASWSAAAAGRPPGHSGNRWVFPEQVDDEGLEPHSVRWFIVPGLAGSATHGVEVTGEPLRRGVASLEAHAAYLAELPGHPAPGTSSRSSPR